MSTEPLKEKKRGEYLVVNEGSMATLICEVTRRISDGWSPQGGVAIASNTYQDCDSLRVTTSFSFHQAMVKP